MRMISNINPNRWIEFLSIKGYQYYTHWDRNIVDEINRVHISSASITRVEDLEYNEIDLVQLELEYLEYEQNG